MKLKKHRTLPYHILDWNRENVQSAKLRVQKRAHVPTCLAGLYAHVPTCLVCLRAYMLTPQRDQVLCTLRCSSVIVSCMLTCSRANVLWVLTWSHANVSCV